MNFVTFLLLLSVLTLLLQEECHMILSKYHVRITDFIKLSRTINTTTGHFATYNVYHLRP